MKLSSFRSFTLIAAAAVTAIYACIFALALIDLMSGGISNEGAAGISLLSMVPSFPASWIALDIVDAVRPSGLTPFDSGFANAALMIAIQWVVAIVQWCLIAPLIVHASTYLLRRDKATR